MGRKLTVAAGVGFACLAIAACGGGGTPADSGSLRRADEVAACLNRAGFVAEKLEEDSDAETVGGHAPDGDTIIVINMSAAIAAHPEVSSVLTQKLRRELRRLGQGGLLTTNSVNGGSTYIGVLGVEGVNGGVAATSTELLARHCAIKGSKGAAGDTT